jgi:hypothetical protein
MTDQQLSRAQQSSTGTAGVTMTGIAQDRYGPAPEHVLRVAELAVPAVAEGHVLVRVHAASVDRGTWHVMAGLPYPIRIAGFGLRRPEYANPGRALAGTVEAVGAGVRGFSPAAAVYGIGGCSPRPSTTRCPACPSRDRPAPIRARRRSPTTCATTPPPSPCRCSSTRGSPGCGAPTPDSGSTPPTGPTPPGR